MNRLEFRKHIAENNGVEIPAGGVLEICQKVHSASIGASDLDVDVLIAYIAILREVVNTWDSHPELLFDSLVLKLCKTAIEEGKTFLYGE